MAPYRIAYCSGWKVMLGSAHGFPPSGVGAFLGRPRRGSCGSDQEEGVSNVFSDWKVMSVRLPT